MYLLCLEKIVGVKCLNVLCENRHTYIRTVCEGMRLKMSGVNSVCVVEKLSDPKVSYYIDQ